MATNLIKNGNFSQGYDGHTAYKYTVDGEMVELQVQEITNPTHWETFFVHGLPVPWDDDNQIGFAQPEVRLATDVPDPNRVMDETTHSLQGFGFYKIIDCGHFQRVSVIPGKRYRLTGYAHAWSSLDDNPRTSEGVGDTAYYSVSHSTNVTPEQANHSFAIGVGSDININNALWNPGVHIYNSFHTVPEIEFFAQTDEVYVFLRDTVMWPYKHNDYYWSQISLVEIYDDLEPGPVECPKPREGWYSRTTVLVHFDAPHEVWRNACEWADHPDRRHDVARAWDPGFWSPGLREVNIKCWQDIPDRFPEGVVKNWGKEYYPSINANITNIIAYDTEPPAGGEPDPIVHYSGNFVGLQHAFPKPGWLTYLIDARPTTVKCFQLSDVIEAKRANPQVTTVWRRVYDGWDTAHMLNAGHAGAGQLVNDYIANIEEYSAATGMSMPAVLAHIDIVESLNETIPSNNATVIKMAVAFDVWFSKLLHEVLEDAVKAGLLNVAVGNPYAVEDDGGAEIEIMLPCAKLSHELGDVLGPHTYWAADENKTYIDEGWKWHAGRWQEWDKVFNAHGYYPTYNLGECGICYTWPNTNGVQFVPKMGWKDCGSFEEYIMQLVEFNTRILEWNARHQGRCLGSNVFIYGQNNWDRFDCEPGDLVELADAMGEYA